MLIKLDERKRISADAWKNEKESSIRKICSPFLRKRVANTKINPVASDWKMDSSKNP
jgi:hypothetical protein